jgi:hypothetical protein
MEFKTTRKLFRNLYQYKIVLICSGASLFRNCDLDSVLNAVKTSRVVSNRSYFKTVEDANYALLLHKKLSSMSDMEIRVESPWLTIYTNSKSDIQELADIDTERVKYICKPSENNVLSVDTIIMPKMKYDYRITLGKTTHANQAFIEWAENSSKCKLTKSCIKELQRPRSWGGTHFYITGDNNLLLAKMHLGGNIAKVERIINNP